MAIAEALMRRLWSRVNSSGGLDACWPFTGYRNKQGYGRMSVGGKVMRAHRIVAIAALGEPSEVAPHTRHLCGNSSCCNPLHLAWGDFQANTDDQRRHGTFVWGTRHGSARLREEDVHAIRAMNAGGMGDKEIAEMFPVSAGMVRLILNGKRWKHLPWREAVA